MTGPMTGRPLSELYSCQGKDPEGHQQKNPKPSQAMSGSQLKFKGFIIKTTARESTTCGVNPQYRESVILMHLLELVRTSTA